MHAPRYNPARPAHSRSNRGLFSSPSESSADEAPPRSAERAFNPPQFTLSGYLPVRPDGKGLFYVYHERLTNPQNAVSPILLWLQGGPGCTSVGYGDLWELGPLRRA